MGAVCIHSERRNTLYRYLCFLILAAALILLLPPAALAHGGIVNSSPEDGDMLAKSPSEIRMTFDVPITLGSAKISLTNLAQETLPTGSIDYSDDQMTLTISLETPLPDGAYTVTFVGENDKDHDLFGASFSFWVQSGSKPDSRVLLVVVGLALLTGIFGAYSLRQDVSMIIEDPESSSA